MAEPALEGLIDALQRLPGVGNVFIGGERRYAMRVWLDPLRMAAYGLTVQDVEQAVRAGNAEIPGGRVEGDAREFAVRTRGELNTPEEFGALIVSHVGDNIVRLDQMAEEIWIEIARRKQVLAEHGVAHPQRHRGRQRRRRPRRLAR